MAENATPTKSRRRTKKDDDENPKQEAATVENGEGGNEGENLNEQDEALETLMPSKDPVVRIIGKPPEHGGDEDEFSRYIQRPLGYMKRMQFFSYVARVISAAMRGGSLSGADFGTGSIGQRAQQLTQQDVADAGSFMQLAFALMGETDDFLLECYCLWMDVPQEEKRWAKEVMATDYDPDRNSWGLDDDDGFNMVEVFIDQNYEEMRSFFAVRLPALVSKIRQQDKVVAKKQGKAEGRASQSVPSKR